MSLRRALFTATMLAVPAAASAQPVTGLYRRRRGRGRAGRQGIAPDEIAVSAYGESRPLVPTADGVREPQNRRVEIVLR
jgi:flagellar motor protein MotB